MSNCFAIASPLGVMDASGTGVVETIQHTSAAHTSVTHEFRAVLSKTHNLFKAFSWSDVDTEGNVDASSGYAEFNLALDQAKFRDALAQVAQVVGDAVPAHDPLDKGLGLKVRLDKLREDVIVHRLDHHPVGSSAVVSSSSLDQVD